MLIGSALVIGAALPRASQAEEHLGSFEAWTAYRYRADKGWVCYLASAPDRRQGVTTRTHDTWVLVTQDQRDNSRNVVSVTTQPVAFARDFAPRLAIGAQRFALMAQGDTAWTESNDADLRLVVAMKRGLRMVLSAPLANGDNLVDSFSLRGFTRALDATTEACRR